MPGTTLRVGDCVYYGMDSFGRERERWRIKFHKKRIEDDFDVDAVPEDEFDAMLHDIKCAELLREKLSREERGLPCTRRFRYVICTQEEATHVSLAGVCGATAPVEECEFIEEVPWPAERIAEERKNAVSKFWLSQRFDWEWE